MITLRALRATDCDALHAVFTETGVRRFLFDDSVLTRDQTQHHLDAAIGHGGWAICDGDRIVGFVSLRPKDGTRELMVAVSEQYWGHGVAFEAARAAMRHGFETLKLARILAAVDLPNERSHRLMLRLGFSPRGESEGPKHRLRTYEALRRSGT